MCLGIPGQITEIYEDNGVRMGRANFGGVVKEICLAYVPELEVGAGGEAPLALPGRAGAIFVDRTGG